MPRRGSHGPPISLFSFQDIITSVAGIIIFLTLMMAVELIQAKQQSPQVQTDAVVTELAQGIPDLQREIARIEEVLASQQEELDVVAAATPSQVATALKDTREQLEALERELSELQKHKNAAEINRQKVSAALEERKGDRETLEELKSQLEQLKKQVEQLKQTNRVIYKNAETAKTAWLVEISDAQIQAMRAGEEMIEKSFASGQVGALVKWIESLNAQDEYVVLVIKPSGVDLFEKLESHFDRLSTDIGFDLIEEQQTVMPGAGP